jgi:hypothetical protein
LTVFDGIVAASPITVERRATHRGGVPGRPLLIGCRWGSLAGGPLRYGGRAYRLVVYPPGTDDRDRRLLQALQWWPRGGPLLAVIAFALLGDPAGLPASFGAAGALFLGPFLWLRHTVRRSRRELAIVHADHAVDPGAPADLARCRRVVWLGSTLVDAERAFDRGELTPVDFQRIWGDVHAEARLLGTVERAA